MIMRGRWNYLFALLWLIVAHLARVKWLGDFALTCSIVHTLFIFIGVLVPKAVE